MRSERINLHLEEPLKKRLDILLCNAYTGRVPKGAYKRFFEQILQYYFDSLELVHKRTPR